MGWAFRNSESALSNGEVSVEHVVNFVVCYVMLPFFMMFYGEIVYHIFYIYHLCEHQQMSSFLSVF